MTLFQHSTNGARRPSVAPSASSVSDAYDVSLLLQLVRQLREGIEQSRSESSAASFTEQLHTLQAERAQLEAQVGTAEPPRICERIQSLEGQIEAVTSSLSALGQQLGTGDIVEFVAKSDATIKSLTEQVQSFRAERPGNADACSKGAAVQRIVEQLHALFEGGAAPTDETSALAGVVGKLHARYAKRGGPTNTGVKGAAVESLVEQVEALHAERAKLTCAFGSADAEAIAAFVLASERRRLVDQLHALYAEREERSRANGGEGQLAAIPGDQPSSSVARPAPTPDAATHTPDAVAQNDNASGDLRPGMFGSGSAVVDSHSNAPVVPSTAVQIKRWAFVLDGDKVERREVISSVDEGNWLETAMGLSAGEEAVNTAEPTGPSSQK
jgi:hypothetical protein